MKPGKWIFGAVVALGMSGSAQAFDWGGFYAGVLGGASFVSVPVCGSDCDRTLTGIAKVVGYTWDNGDTLVGIDKMVIFTAWPDDENIRKVSFQKMVRWGVEVSDRAMIYGGVGGGLSAVWDGPNYLGAAFYGAIAGGLEYALSDTLSWRTHAQFSHAPDPAPLSPISAFSVVTGIVWMAN